MVSKNGKGLAWFKFFVADWLTSPDVLRMTAAERGVFITLLVWQVESGGSIPKDTQMLAKLTGFEQRLLDRFFVYNWHLFPECPGNPRRIANDKLVSICSFKDLPEDVPIDKIREEEKRQEKDRLDGWIGGDATSDIAEKPGALTKGTPGYYEPGQYPSGKEKARPKEIYKHVARAWATIKGVGAICRYPSKYPEAWEDLCTTKDADLIVPAFELWAVKEGGTGTNQFPISDFLRVAHQYTVQVIPLNSTGVKNEQADHDAAKEAYLESLRQLAAAKPPVVDEPGPEAL